MNKQDISNTNITDLSLFFKIDRKIVASIYKEWFLNWMDTAYMNYWMIENEKEKQIKNEIDKFLNE
jgi:hypothetical protein